MRTVVSSQVLDAGHVWKHPSVATQGHDPLTAVPPASYREGRLCSSLETTLPEAPCSECGSKSSWHAYPGINRKIAAMFFIGCSHHLSWQWVEGSEIFIQGELAR